MISEANDVNKQTIYIRSAEMNKWIKAQYSPEPARGGRSVIIIIIYYTQI